VRALLIDTTKCIACGACVSVCPVGALVKTSNGPVLYEEDRCIGCRYCIQACPTGVTTAGTRDALLEEARTRLAAEPAKYIQTIYGEKDGGGTSVLYLSSVPFEKLGLPLNLGVEPLPHLTFKVLSKIPPAVGVGSCALAALWWLTKRKAEVAKSEAPQAPEVRS